MRLPARTGFKEVVVVNSPTITSYPLSITTDNPVRCSDFSITPTQAVELPELIQGAVDKTAYQINQRTIEGGMTFPLVAEVGNADTVGTPPGSTSDFTTFDPGIDTIFTNAITNANTATTLYETFEVGSTYHGIFKNCMINDISISGEEGGAVTVDSTIWPTHIEGDYDDDDRETEGDYPTDYYNLQEVEVIMFYNVRINEGNNIELGAWDLAPSLIRNFTINVDNALERNFTYNQSESAHDITRGIRSVSGDFTFQINWNTDNNPYTTRFPRFAEIMSKLTDPIPELKFECGGGTGPGFTYTFTLRNPIFEAANQPIAVGILTQTVNFHAVADQGVDNGWAIDYSTS